MLVPLATCATGADETPSAPATERVAQVDSLGVGATREAAGSYRLVLVTEDEDGDGTRRAVAGTRLAHPLKDPGWIATVDHLADLRRSREAREASRIFRGRSSQGCSDRKWSCSPSRNMSL